MSPRALEGIGVAALGALAVALALVHPTYPNYDSYYHLVWGRELLDGVAPSFEAYQAPTQHPLYLAAAALLGLLGRDADRLLVVLTIAAWVALIWGVYRLGQRLFGRAAGAAAALFATASPAFLLYAVRAYVDVPFLALVVWAAVYAARRPDGLAAPWLLVLAGTLRPEAWVLGGLLWMWRARGWAGPRRLRRAGLVVVAPIIWAAVDLAVTGDPLHSLHATSDLADELGRNRGIGSLPGSFVSFLADTVRPPVALLALAGAALAWRHVEHRRLVVPAGLFGAGALTFVATGLAGLSILPRYLTVPAVVLCLLAGYALAGFLTLPAGSGGRRLWGRAAVVALVAGAVFAVTQLSSVDRLTTELRFSGEVHDDLTAVLRRPEAVSGLRCGPLTLPNYRLVPDARWFLDLPRERVGSRSARRRSSGVALFVLGEKALRRFGFADGASPQTNVPDPGFERVAVAGHFSAYVRCP